MKMCLLACFFLVCLFWGLVLQVYSLCTRADVPLAVAMATTWTQIWLVCDVATALANLFVEVAPLTPRLCLFGR